MSPARERIPQRGLASVPWAALGLAGVTIVASAVQPGAAIPQSALQACVSIALDSDRLACYDRLAGRVVPSTDAPLVQPVTPPPAAFGLYEAEHPKPPPVALSPSLKARVVALGRSTGGRMSVSLEGGAVWELDQADPLLAVGDSVTLTRAAFGSYIMHTPTGRTHRVQRLR